MNALLVCLLGILMLLGVGCDDGSDPSGTDVDTIYVRDSSRMATMVGRVQIYSDCQTLAFSGGVRVEIPELGVDILTDDSGQYSFKTSNVQRFYRIRISKPGIYTATFETYTSYNEDSAKYLIQPIVTYQFFDYSGEIADTMRYTRTMYPKYKDSTYVDSTGIVRTMKVVVDSLDYSSYTFAVAGLDQNDRHSLSVKPVLLVGKIPSIDPLDSTTYLFSTHTDMGAKEYWPLSVYNISLEAYGIKRGDKFYIAASGIGLCAPEGTRAGKRRSAIREMTMR